MRRTPMRRGHQGNRKNWVVHTRPSAEERKEKLEFGCEDVDAWDTTVKMTCKRAFDYAAKWRGYGYEVRTVQIKAELDEKNPTDEAE